MFSPEGIHIINGQSAAGALLQAHNLAERVLVHNEILSCGPTPQCADIQQWAEIRWEYLRLLPTGKSFKSYRDTGLLKAPTDC